MTVRTHPDNYIFQFSDHEYELSKLMTEVWRLETYTPMSRNFSEAFDLPPPPTISP